MTANNLTARIGLVTLAAALGTSPVFGQAGAKNGEWPTYGGDLGNTRYSPLDQINAEQLQQARGRLALQDRQPRAATRVPVRSDAADGQRRRSTRPPDRGAPSSRSTPAPASCCGCTARTKARAATAAPRQLSGRGLAYWTDGTEERILYVTPGYRLIALDAKTGAPIASFGKNGIVDLKLEDDQADRSGHRRDRPALGADRRRKTSSSSAPRIDPAACPEEQDERQGLRPRLRRADRQAPVDLPHHSAAGRVRQRHVGERLVVVHRQHRRVGPDLGRRGARPGVPAGRTADRRLLRRPSARQRPVRREPRRRRSEDRQAQVALPAGAPRHLGHGHPVRADSGRHHRQRPDDQGASRSRPSRRSSTCSIARPASRSGRSRSGRSRRATCRASGIRRRSRSRPSRRPTSAQGVVDRRSDRLHAGAARGSAEASCRSTSSGRCSRRRS